MRTSSVGVHAMDLALLTHPLPNCLKMCVAMFTLDRPDYALILCSNRDEYLSRPTQPACFHSFDRPGDPDVLSGIDVQAGGTWLGLTRAGNFGLLTNITEPSGTYASSRGELVSSFLSVPSSRALEDDVRKLVPPDAHYAGFNLLLLSPADDPSLSFDALYVTNHGGDGPITYRPLTSAQRRRGGLSNGVDGSGADDWPKIQHGVRAFEALLDGLPPDTSDDQLTERLFDLLTWVLPSISIVMRGPPSSTREVAIGSLNVFPRGVLRWRSSQPPRDRSELRNTIQVDPLYVDGALNGTCLSTVVLVKRSGEVVFTERERWKLNEQGRPILADPSSQRVFRFKIDKGGLSM